MRADAVLDPFTGRPLVLKPVAGGYLVYSVGQNRRDDGGDVRAVRPSHVAPGLAVDSLDVGVRILTSPGAFSAQE